MSGAAVEGVGEKSDMKDPLQLDGHKCVMCEARLATKEELQASQLPETCVVPEEVFDGEAYNITKAEWLPPSIQMPGRRNQSQ